MKTKEEFHDLIDKIEDEEVLRSYFNLIKTLSKNHTGKLWDDLSSEEKNELLLSFEESFDSTNLISHEDVKNQHEKWLRKKYGPKEPIRNSIR